MGDWEIVPDKQSASDKGQWEVVPDGQIATQPISNNQPQQDQLVDMSALDYVGNKLPNSAIDAAKNIGNAVMHPIQTAKGVGNVVAGTVEKFSPVSMALKATGVIPKELPQEKYFNDVANQANQSFGTPTRALNTLYNDPIGTAMNVAMIAEPFNGGIRKTAVDVAKGTPEISSIAKDALLSAKGGLKRADALDNLLDAKKTSASTLYGQSMKDIQSLDPTRTMNLEKVLNKPRFSPAVADLLDSAMADIQKRGHLDLSKLPLEEGQDVISTIKDNVNKKVLTGDITHKNLDVARLINELSDAKHTAFPEMKPVDLNYGDKIDAYKRLPDAGKILESDPDRLKLEQIKQDLKTLAPETLPSVNAYRFIRQFKDVPKKFFRRF